MCGIAGIVGKGLAGTQNAGVAAMVSSLTPRGPDDTGHVAFPNCVLVHTRLSILDLEAGQQPMQDEAAGLTVVFNGEIYNFMELRSELSRRGNAFTTQSDTEVILKAYREYGEDCVQRLDGMFAFAMWDNVRNRLYLARDRFGKKPLYYAYDSEGNFLFASEIKALVASGRVRPAVDREALDAYLRLLYVPPDRTIYRNVFALRPGHVATYEDGRLQVRRYWEIPDRPIRLGYEEAREEVRRLLQAAVRRRMVADVEIGSLLSGGVDSTMVTHFAQANTARPLKTFSVGYGDHINELPYARAAAERIGTDHYELQVGGPELAGELLEVAAYFDEPHADSSNAAQSLVSKLARSKVKVALCGDGGDEVFLGYDWYWQHWRMSRRHRVKQMLISSPFRAYMRRKQVFGPDQRSGLWGGRPPTKEEYPYYLRNGLRGGLNAINRWDLEVYLPGQLLVKADRAGMMHSLEVRSPLLDRELVEFVYNLPAEYKTDRRQGKLILKDLLRETMPSSFVDRKKRGFGAPVTQWLRTLLREPVLDLLGGNDAMVYGFLDERYIRRMLAEFYETGSNAAYMRIWSLLCLELWMRKHSPCA